MPVSKDPTKRAEWLAKIGKANSGNSYALGSKRSKITKLKLSKLAKTRFNEKNPNWKGEKVKISALHQWMERKFGRAKDSPCNFCGDTRVTKVGGKKPRKYWANLDHKYTRDLSKWTILCGVCHTNYDRIILGAKIGRQKKYA